MIFNYKNKKSYLNKNLLFIFIVKNPSISYLKEGIKDIKIIFSKIILLKIKITTS